MEAHQSGLNINLYVQIGFVLLVALSAKNAILIVEFARELRAAGRPILEAGTEAARARFRPIVMTSFAFILGVVPLVLAIGASARTSIGITVFTGMIASTCLAVLFVPPRWRSISRNGASRARVPRRRVGRPSSNIFRRLFDAEPVRSSLSHLVSCEGVGRWPN